MSTLFMTYADASVISQHSGELDLQFHALAQGVAALSDELQQYINIAEAPFSSHNRKAKATLVSALPNITTDTPTKLFSYHSALNKLQRLATTALQRTNNVEKQQRLQTLLTQIQQQTQFLQNQAEPLLARLRCYLHYWFKPLGITHNPIPSAPAEDSSFVTEPHSFFQSTVHDIPANASLTLLNPGTPQSIPELYATITQFRQRIHAELDDVKIIASKEFTEYRDILQTWRDQCTHYQRYYLHSLVSLQQRIDGIEVIPDRIASNELLLRNIAQCFSTLDECETFLTWKKVAPGSTVTPEIIREISTELGAQLSDQDELHARLNQLCQEIAELPKHYQAANTKNRRELYFRRLAEILHAFTTRTAALEQQCQLRFAVFARYEQLLATIAAGDTDISSLAPYIDAASLSILYQKAYHARQQANRANAQLRYAKGMLNAEENWLKQLAQHLLSEKEWQEYETTVTHAEEELNVLEGKIDHFARVIDRHTPDEQCQHNSLNQLHERLQSLASLGNPLTERLGDLTADEITHLATKRTRQTVTQAAASSTKQITLRNKLQQFTTRCQQALQNMGVLFHQWTGYKNHCVISQLSSVEHIAGLENTLHRLEHDVSKLAIATKNYFSTTEQSEECDNLHRACQSQLTTAQSLHAKLGPHLSVAQLTAPPLSLTEQHAHTLIKMRERVSQIQQQLSDWLYSLQSLQQQHIKSTHAFPAPEQDILPPLSAWSVPPTEPVTHYSQSGLPVSLANAFVRFYPQAYLPACNRRPRANERISDYCQASEEMTVRQMVLQAMQWGWTLQFAPTRNKKLFPLIKLACAFATVRHWPINWQSLPDDSFRYSREFTKLCEHERTLLQQNNNGEALQLIAAH